MKVGKNVALFVYDRARAGAFYRLRKHAKEIAHSGGRLNVNDAGRDGFINFDVVLLICRQRRVCDACRHSLREGRRTGLKMAAELSEKNYRSGGKDRRQERYSENLTG